MTTKIPNAEFVVLVQSQSQDLFGNETYTTRAAFDAADFSAASTIANRQKLIWADPACRVIIEQRTGEGTYAPVSWRYYKEGDDDA